MNYDIIIFKFVILLISDALLNYIYVILQNNTLLNYKNMANVNKILIFY